MIILSNLVYISILAFFIIFILYNTFTTKLNKKGDNTQRKLLMIFSSIIILYLIDLIFVINLSNNLSSIWLIKDILILIAVISIGLIGFNGGFKK